MGKTSSITVDGSVVTKRITRFSKFGIFENEVFWLEKMASFDRVPNLVSSDKRKKKIVMNYVGSMITNGNIPKNWKDQAEEIILGLKKHKCSHNDIKPSEIMVIDNKLRLIDFGWSTRIGEPIPKKWPRGLGSKYRLADHKFCDRHALYASIRFVLTGKLR